MKSKTHISLNPLVKAKAIRYAKTEQRSLSEVVERLLEREIDRVELQDPVVREEEPLDKISPHAPR